MRAACLVIADFNELNYIEGDWNRLHSGLEALLKRSSDYRERLEAAVQRMMQEAQILFVPADGQAYRDLQALLLSGIGGQDCQVDDCEKAHVVPAGNAMKELDSNTSWPALVAMAHGVISMLHRRTCGWSEQLLEMQVRKLDSKLTSVSRKGQRTIAELKLQYNNLLRVPYPNI